uniref:PDZ domain-containing protein n=1 Tax=Ditylenchus dipsaci TaxID=166011 RepID=A0A915E0X0_9BILA
MIFKYSDFGIILGCKYYIKEITNPRLAEKEPGLKEGDTVLRVNGQTLEGVTLEEAARLLHRSREKLSLVVQRDVRRGSAGSRWPSQTTVYERLEVYQQHLDTALPLSTIPTPPAIPQAPPMPPPCTKLSLLEYLLPHLPFSIIHGSFLLTTLLVLKDFPIQWAPPTTRPR